MSDAEYEAYVLSAGRSVFWPLITKAISQKPLFGWGKAGMITCGASAYMLHIEDRIYRHPHNAYLELLLDFGVLGTIPWVVMYSSLALISYKLFRRGRDEIAVASRGMQSGAVVERFHRGNIRSILCSG